MLFDRLGLGPAKPQELEPVLAEALRQPPYGFQAKVSQSIQMYGLPADWSLELVVPADPPAHSEAEALLQQIHERTEVEIRRVVADLQVTQAQSTCRGFGVRLPLRLAGVWK